MNLFLAIVPPDDVKKSIFDQLKKLREDYKDINWINPINYHLTVRYFGDVIDQKALGQKISNLLYDKEKFYLCSRGLDLFMRHKINIYLSFYREKKLELLEKDLVPHISLGSYRIPSKQQYFLLKKKIENYDLEVEFTVKKLILYESIFANSQVSYKQLKQFPLL